MKKLSRKFLTLFLDVDESVGHSLVTADILATVWWNYFYILPKDWNCLIRGWCNLVVDVCALTLAKAINTRVLSAFGNVFLFQLFRFQCDLSDDSTPWLDHLGTKRIHTERILDDLSTHDLNIYWTEHRSSAPRPNESLHPTMAQAGTILAIGWLWL